MSTRNGIIDPIAFSNRITVWTISMSMSCLLSYVMIHGHRRMHMAPLHKLWCYLPNYTSLTAHPIAKCNRRVFHNRIRPLHNLFASIHKSCDSEDSSSGGFTPVKHNCRKHSAGASFLFKSPSNNLNLTITTFLPTHFAPNSLLSNSPSWILLTHHPHHPPWVRSQIQVRARASPPMEKLARPSKVNA